MSVAAIGALPGNLLNLQNQSFATGIGSWTTSTAAASLATSTAQTFEGPASAIWSSTGSLSSIISGALPVAAGQPYIASGYVRLPSAGTASMEIKWSTGAITTHSTRYGNAGAFLGAFSMGATDFTSALSTWTGLTLPSPAAARYYRNLSVFTYDTSMSEIVASGTKMVLDLRPAYNPTSASDLSAMTTLLQTLQNAGAVVDVTLWAEPYYNGLSVAQYQAMIAYYGPTVRQYFPLVFCTSVASVHDNGENAYYPGDAAVDKCAADFYANVSNYGLDLAATPANNANPPKPFGLYEIGASTDPLVGQSSASVASHLSYITTYFQNRTANGLPNSDLLWFDSGGFNILSNPNIAGYNSQNAGFEGGVGGWVASVGTGTSTTTQHNTGADSYLLTANAAGTPKIQLGSGTGSGAIAVTGGTTYTLAASFRAATIARSVIVGVNWYTSAGVFTGSSGFGGSTVDSTTAWVQTAQTCLAPATAAFANLICEVVSVAGSGEQHFIDDVLFTAQNAVTTVMGMDFGSAPSTDWRIPLWTSLASALVTLENSPAGWTPVICNGIAPSGATSAQVILTAAGASGSSVYADMVYFARSTVQVLADWTNPVFLAGSLAGNAFVDLTPFVNSENSQIQMTHGRQDAIAEVQNGTCQYVADNLQGWFTLYNSASPYSVEIGARTQVNISYGTSSSGTFVYTPFQTRFDGTINEFDYSIDPIAGIPRVQINCRDIIGTLSNQPSMSCWAKQRILYDKPLRFWALDDANGVTQAQETSGNGGSPLYQRKFGTSCSGAFGSGHNGIETQQDTQPWAKTVPGPWPTSTLNSYYSSQSATSSNQVSGHSAPLAGEIPFLYLNGNVVDAISSFSSSNGWSVEIWATPDPTAATVWSTSNVAQLGILGLNAAYWGTLDVWMHATNASVSASLFVGQPGSFTTACSITGLSTSAWNATNPQPVHIVVECSTGSVLTVYINGTSQTCSVPAANQGMAFDQINIGDLGRPSNAADGFSGNLSLAAVYSGQLSSATVLAHYNIGRAGLAQSLSGAVVSQLASFSGIPGFWIGGGLSTSGLTALDYFDLTGANALAGMQQAEAAEAGLLWADQSGHLRFSGRDVRMGAGSGSLTLPPGSFTANLGTKVTDQYVQTSAAVAGTAYGTTLATRFSIGTGSTTVQPFTNGISAVSQATAAMQKVGPYPNGAPSSPTTLPVQTVAQALPNPGTVLPYAQDIADWNVNRNALPPYKASTLTIDILTQQDPAAAEWIAPAVVAAQDINAVVTLNMSSNTASFPNQTGFLDQFVEGVTEVVGTSVHTIEFYTSPANTLRCWVPGDTKLGVLDQTAVIGISAESAKPNIVANNPSDPGGTWLAPSYSTSMNQNQGASGYVGASDQRGIWYQLLTTLLRPPVMVGYNASQPSIASNSWTPMAVNYTLIDTAQGWNTNQVILNGITGSGYIVPISGFYDINGYVQLPSMTAAKQGKIRVTSYDLRTGVEFVLGCGNSGESAGATGTTTPVVRCRAYLGAGAIVAFWVNQNDTGPITIGQTELSIEFIGFSYTAD